MFKWLRGFGGAHFGDEVGAGTSDARPNGSDGTVDTFPGRYLALVLAIVVGTLCFSALGIAVSTFVPNEDAAPAIINLAPASSPPTR